MFMGTMSVDDKNHLTIGGCDTVALAHRYGTPLYVLDEHFLRQKARTYRTIFNDLIPGSKVLYAGKALLNSAVCRIMAEEGLGLDVVSGGELYTALTADFPREQIYFHGNNKSSAELKMALERGIGRIVVDNIWELKTLGELAARRGVNVSILIRLTPGVEPNTHSYVRTGQFDSKFGLPINADTTMDAIRQAVDMPGIDLKGFHCHIGSQIMELDAYQKTVRLMIEFLARLKRGLGLTVEELDLGGGLGITYLPDEKSPSLLDYAHAISSALTTSCQKHRLAMPQIAVEPGRSIVGEAGITLYTIGAVKEVPGVRKYVAVDGGMADNPRVAMYGAKYTGCLANRVLDDAEELVTIAGKCCESGDILIRDISLPTVRTGDILAVYATGAYNYSMASNYNRLPRPAMVLVWQGKSDIIVERETYDDLVRLDRIPQRLTEAKAAVVKG